MIPAPTGPRWRWIGAAVALLPLFGWSCRRQPPPAAPTTSPSASRPIQRAPTATTTATRPPAPAGYIDVVRLHNPNVPATQPLDIPVDVRDAAHLLLPEPVYIDPPGHLWITRDDAPPIDTSFFRRLSSQQMQGRIEPILVPRRVLFVAWYAMDNKLTPLIVCAGDNAAGDSAAPVAIGPTRTTTLPPRHYLWDRAIATLDTMYVPTDGGVSAFSLPALAESHHELLSADDIAAVAAGRITLAAPRLVFDWRGKVLAWIPCDDSSQPGTRPARYGDHGWTDLTGPDWSDRLLHLVPLGNGTALELIHNADNTVSMRLVVLDQLPIDEKHVGELVDKLNSLDPTERDAASAELAALGPAAWSFLERVADQQPPEAQSRIAVILQARNTPSLAGLTTPSGQLKVMAANRSGGVVLYAPSMVQENPDGPPRVIAPAWVQLIPGRPVMILPQQQVAALDVKRDSFLLCGNDLLILDPVLGLRWFDGSDYQNLTRKSEADFRQLVDRDSAGRWFVVRPPTGLPTMPPLPPASGPSTTAPTTQPAASAVTLVIDPTIADPAPRLPVWLIDSAPQSGWDSDNWPAIKSGGAWRLKDSDWEPIDESKTPFITKLPDPIAPPATAATTTSTTAPATEPDPSLQHPLLVAADGTRYYDGLTTLTVLRRDQAPVVWPLPPTAVGDGPATLLQSRDGRLFLFNAAGRVVRIHATPDSPEPFALDAVFTHGIPDSDHPTRIWLDPAGRIVFSDGKDLWVMFPTGRIPPDIREKMPANSDVDDDQ